MYIVDEWAGHRADPACNMDRVWAACYTSTGDYIALWGRRGNRNYRSLTKQLKAALLSKAKFERMVAEKLSEGYRPVPFEDPRYGTVPSFKTGFGPTGAGAGPGPGSGLTSTPPLPSEPASRASRSVQRPPAPSPPKVLVAAGSGNKITPATLLVRIQGLVARISRRFEPDTMLMEYQQLKALSLLTLEYGTDQPAEEAAAVAAGQPALDELERGLECLTGRIKQALLA